MKLPAPLPPSPSPSIAHETSSAEPPDKRLARLTGLLYLILFPTSGLAYGVGQTLLAGGADAAIPWLQTHLPQFKLAILLGALGYIDFLLLALAFYRLLRTVSQSAAGTMLALVAVSVPVSLAAIARWLDVLTLLQSTDLLSADQQQTQILLALRGYDSLFHVSAIFWGLWLLPLGWLVARSGFLPRAIGFMLMLGSAFYVAAFLGPVLDPGFASSATARIIGIASGVPGLLGGELAICLWLLIVGVRTSRVAAQPSA